MNNSGSFTSILSRLALAFGLAASLAAQAALIGQWPFTQPYLWETQPFSPVAGSNWVERTSTVDNLVMTALGTGTKNTSWLPYTVVSNAYAEKLCIAQLVGPANAPVTNVHVKVLDQGTTGKHGWDVIFKDGTGRIFDFGVRPYFKTGYLMAHEWDGTNWVNYTGNGFFAPYTERPKHGNDYYTMDFTQNVDGTIMWTVAGYSPTAGDFLTSITNTTSIPYGSLTGVYLNASTPTSDTQNYKWTEFSVSPQVYSPPPLRIAPTNTAQVFLSWPSPWNSFALQTNDDLNISANWAAVTNAPSDDGTNVTVTIPVETGHRFFRLAK